MRDDPTCAASAVKQVMFHASLGVSNLERSVAFYRTMLGCEPLKRRADYAKFELADPPLVLVSLGVLCSGLAYLAFFTLVRDIGPTRSLSTGLAAPALGVLWGWLLLDESVTLPMPAGVALVISALFLVLRR